jgi:hypothetical protein
MNLHGLFQGYLLWGKKAVYINNKRFKNDIQVSRFCFVRHFNGHIHLSPPPEVRGSRDHAAP